MEDILALIDDIESIDLMQDVAGKIKDFVNGPLGAEIFISLCKHPQREIASSIALELLSNSKDPGTIMEIVSWLVRGGDTATINDRDLWNAFVQRVEDKDSHYALRAQALLGALYLSQTDKALLRRLQGVLLDTNLDDDARYLRYVAKIIGTILSHEIDEDLQKLLYQLSNIEDAQDEVWLEIGMHQLRLGLEATNYQEALTAFIDSSSSFEKSLNASEQRFDADLFYQCVSMLINFLEDRDRERIQNQIEGIQKATFNYLAFTTNSDRDADTNSWIGLSNQVRVHWSLLAWHLGKLDLTFKKKAWLRAVDVIENQLLIVFTASRTILKRNQEGGLESYLRPKLIGGLQKERIYLNFLEQWIDENSDDLEINNAELMRDEILRYKEQSLFHRPKEAVIDGSTITAILDKGQVSSDDQKEIQKQTRAYFETWRETTANPIVEEIESYVIGELLKNSCYKKLDDARHLFNIFLSITIRFLVSRMNDNVSTIPHMAYLFVRDKDNLPKENDLQSDYYGFLKSSDIADIVDTEVRNIAAGRVDILFKFNGIKFVAELKQEQVKRSNDELVKRYGAQEISYDSTNVTFGILMVLDLFDRKGGQPHITEQVSVHHITPSWRETEHTLVLFRVQGCRKTPSSIGL
ncbi:hypothetical protein B9T12_08980 [Wohlfahrtiimonas chitiniclastica]|uniref:hypothetical protein n=1 Tax=Wohlfahrtiimonas chitiniclastica TaxID=400946 RepID=UPI000B97EBB1|nr:hypothetical protein [Wohlfahrtiimonas chitiniclastica]OYQ77096.1 hypothetical protein B9T12_08980 [Wohlfahrtiimonas chitiniclastica]